MAAAVRAQYALLIWGTHLALTADLRWYEFLGMFFSVGCTSGLAINIAHELGHQTSPVERWRR